MSQTSTVVLENIFMHVTKACNLRCTYCYFAASRPMPNEMATAEFERLWPDIVRLVPRKVIFTGGEPLLRPDILELLQGLRDADPHGRVKRCINTNGHLLTPALSQSLVGLADEVRVSLDGLATRNDLMRGAGNFEAALVALDRLQEVGFEPKVMITVTSITLPDLEALLALLFKKRHRRIKVNLFRPIGRGDGQS